MSRSGLAGRARATAPAAGALAAGLTLWAAFPPLGLWWTAPLGLAALVLLLEGRRPVVGAGLGLLFGLGLFTPLLHFTAVAMGNAIGWVALTLVQSAYLVAFGVFWPLVARLGPLADASRPRRAMAQASRVRRHRLVWRALVTAWLAGA